jgi:hypothetical protein
MLRVLLQAATWFARTDISMVVTTALHFARTFKILTPSAGTLMAV